jgi:hypothetical protein
MAKPAVNRSTIRNARAKTPSKLHGTVLNGRNSGMWKTKSIEELAAEQGVSLQGQLERIWGAGADLWANDKEFEEFVQGIYDRRKEGLRLGKR